MSTEPWGELLEGDSDVIRDSWKKFDSIPVDLDRTAEPAAFSVQETTLATTASATGPGTFFRRAQRTLVFEPSTKPGWWLKREDLPECLPIAVSVHNVWTTARNIVLCSGSPHNYMRMVEHIIALKVGLGLDRALIRMISGDPPLFDRGSADLVEAVDRAGLCPLDVPAKYITVRKTVSITGPNGSFLVFSPPPNGSRALEIDCAVDFRSAIGKQRIRLVVTPNVFRYGAQARTNTTLGMMLYAKTVGLLFADVRNLGYTTRNILIAGPRRYYNRPALIHNGRSLEAVWHRAMLDLLAAIALIPTGRFAGRVFSYKAGHTLDVRMIKALHERDLLADI